MKQPSASRIKRFWKKTAGVGDCIEWTGSRCGGYGQTGFMGKVHKAHRVAWFFKYGKFPNIPLDHLCRNRACVNTDHLEEVTNKENILRGVCPTAINKRKTHCNSGHPLTGYNLIIRTNGSRACRNCKNYRARNKK